MSDTFDARCPIVWPTKRRKMSDRCRSKSARCPIVPGTNGARCPIGGSSERQEGSQTVYIGVPVSGSGQNGARCPIPPISNGARCPIVATEQNQGAGRACLGRKWDRFLPEPQNQPARNRRDSGPRGLVRRKMSDSLCRGWTCRASPKHGKIPPDSPCHD